MSKRVQVKVIVEFDTIGKTTPIKLTWPDGREFAIDRVLDVRPTMGATSPKRKLVGKVRQLTGNLIDFLLGDLAPWREKWKLGWVN